MLHEAIAVNPFLRTIMKRKPLWEKVAENLVVMGYPGFNERKCRERTKKLMDEHRTKMRILALEDTEQEEEEAKELAQKAIKNAALERLKKRKKTMEDVDSQATTTGT